LDVGGLSPASESEIRKVARATTAAATHGSSSAKEPKELCLKGCGTDCCGAVGDPVVLRVLATPAVGEGEG
jgi:hypothetical protein